MEPQAAAEKKHATISLCCILKNEGKTIFRMLESCLGFVDEWIVGIDKSTDDNTRAEVERFFAGGESKAQVYDYEWQNDFSKARNDGMARATEDYCLIMDGHEYFPESWMNITEERVIPVRQALIHVKEMLGEDRPDEAHLCLYQQPFYGQIPNNFFLQPRIYRRDEKIRFNRAAHNTIVGTDQKKAIHFPEIILIHDAPDDNRADRSVQRIAMNEAALRADLEKNPNDTRAMFYLGNTLMEAKRWAEAREMFEKYLASRKDETSEKYQVLIHHALTCKELGDMKAMRDSVYAAISINPLRKDGYNLAGTIYMQAEKWPESIVMLDTAIRLKPQPSRMFQNGMAQTWDCHQKISYALAKVGDITKAIAHLKIAYSFWPNPKWEEQITAWTGGARKNILIADAIGSFTGPIEKHFAGQKERFNTVAVSGFDSRLAIWADFIFCEWGDRNSAKYIEAAPGKVVVRIHGYEAYTNLQLLERVKWENAKKVIFVADHIEKMVSAACKIPAEKIALIPNGVDTEKFFIWQAKPDISNIGIAGLMNSKKDPLFLARLICAMKDFRFNLRLDWQDPFLKAAFEHETRNCKNIIHHGRYENLADFWQKMTFVISTSAIESFSFNVAEAMACGCYPIIYGWNGADKVWPVEYICRDFEQMVSGAYSTRKKIKTGWSVQSECRKVVVEKYPLDRMLAEIEKVLLA